MDLQTLWFVLIVFFWAGYFLLEGFDFGVGMLLPILPRDDRERSILFASIGPVWDGNEVWLIVAGGATFAAFPAWYATMFSGFYIALLLLLLLLIVRVLSFEWRMRSHDERWRTFWLWCNAVGSFGASLLWGVGLANLLYGVPINGNGNFAGSFWDLFSIYTVLAGVAFVLLFAFHGATFLTLRTTGDLCARALATARQLAIWAAFVAGAFLAATVTVAVRRNDKDLWMPLVPAVLGVAALGLAVLFVRRGSTVRAFTMTAIGTVLTVTTLFVGLYPRVMVSDPDFRYSLTVENAASAHYTLAVMTVVAVITAPVILLYQGWTYHVFRHRVGGEPEAAATPDP
jgi:cytochrome bd ubiquinol oxidase subunit II